MTLDMNGADRKRAERTKKAGSPSANNGEDVSAQPEESGASQHDANTPQGDAPDTEAIKKQIAPGLRSMYANVLGEDLPDDLLAIVDALADDPEDTPPEDTASNPEDQGKDADHE